MAQPAVTLAEVAAPFRPIAGDSLPMADPDRALAEGTFNASATTVSGGASTAQDRIDHAGLRQRGQDLLAGLGSAPADAQGAIIGGSSGGAAFVMGSSGSLVIGQRHGACFSEEDPCDADVEMTVDGALAAAFPQIRRYLYEDVFHGDFESR